MRTSPLWIAVILVAAMLLLTSVTVSVPVTADMELPDTYDIDTDPDRRYGEIFPVRSQGSLGTCWAFAASAAVESGMRAVDGSYTMRISPLAMAYTQWDSNTDDSLYRYNDVLCCTQSKGLLNTGSQNTFTFYGLTSGKISVVPEYCSVYDTAVGKYDYTQSRQNSADEYIVIKGIECYDLSNDADIIKQRIMDGYVGAMGYRVGQMGVSDGTTTDFTYYYDNLLSDHAVALVGWDDSYSKDNFLTKPSSDGAWRVRNTYSASDLTDGYTWLSYETVVGSVYFITDAEYHISDGTRTNVYAYDMGYSSDSDIITTGTAYMANVFTVQSDEILEGVSFSALHESYDTYGTYNTIGERYSISVYRLNEGYTSPEDGTIAATASGTVSCMGIIYEELDESVALKEGDIFSVVIELHNPTGVSVIPVDTEFHQGNYHFYTAANPGESYVNTDGSWKDISADRMSNVRIKAYTIDSCTHHVSSSDGSKSYGSISEAIADGTYDIKLLSDITVTSSIVSDHDLTVDLNAYRITSTADGYSFDLGDRYITLMNGYLSSSDSGIRAKSVKILNAELNCSDVSVTAESADISVSAISKGKVDIHGTEGSKTELFCSSDDDITLSNTDVHVTGGIYHRLSISECSTEIADGRFYDIIFTDGAASVDDGTFSELSSVGCSLTINNGNFEKSSFSGGTVIINVGTFFNDTSWTSETQLTIFRGYGFTADSASEIEVKIAQKSKDKGYVARGSKENGWNVELPDSYIGSVPCESIESALSGPDATIALVDDTVTSSEADDIEVTNNITVDLNGHELDLNKVVVCSGASLTLKNGTVIIEKNGLSIDSGGHLTVGSDDTETSVSCGTSMINAVNGAEITCVGDDTHISWVFSTDSTSYYFDISSISFIGSQMIIESDGTAKDKSAGTKISCTVIRTIWTDSGRSYDSKKTVPGEKISLDALTVTGSDYSYSSVYENGKFVMKSTETTEEFRFDITNSIEDGIVSISALYYGLRYSSSVSDDAVDTICGFVDDITDKNAGCQTEFELTCNIMDYSWHDTSLPYKVFSQYALNELRARGCDLIYRMTCGTVCTDLSAVSEGSIFYSKAEYVQNSHLTAEQSSVIRENEAYYVDCSSESVFVCGIKVSIPNSVQDKSGLKLYKVSADGTFDEIVYESDINTITFIVYDSGIYAFSGSKTMTIGTQPSAVKDLVCNGSMQELIEPAYGINGGYAVYSLDNVTWSSDVPCAKDAGTYTVYYRYVASELGYSDMAGGSLNTVIAEAPKVQDTSKEVIIAIAVSVAVFVILVLAYLAAVYRRP